MKDYKNKKAFTFVEVLAALVILGLVAAMVIPSAVRRSTETANRTKIKKAMATYEKVMSEYYISGEHTLYSADKASVSGRIGKNGELAGLTGEAYEAEKARLTQERADKKAHMASYYPKTFQSHFKVHTKESGSVFMTSDKLWWDIGTNGDFTTIKVAFKREDLTDAMADSNEYKAFYFIAKQSGVAVTPDTNPTLGMALSDIKPSDLNGKTDDEIKDINRMQKLYNYINNKISSKYCPNDSSPSKITPNCCTSTKGKCVETYTKNKLAGVYLKAKLTYKYSVYDNGKSVGVAIYDNDDHWTAYMPGGKKEVEITYDDGSPKRCYTYGGSHFDLSSDVMQEHLRSRDEQKFSYDDGYYKINEIDCEN